MIHNAKDDHIYGGLPDVSPAVDTLLMPVRVNTITKTLIDGYVKEKEQAIDTKAARMPAKEGLEIRADGDRSWKWWTLYFSSPLPVNNDDVIVLNGVRYRVMEKHDWIDYGFIMVHCIEDYEGYNV